MNEYKSMRPRRQLQRARTCRNLKLDSAFLDSGQGLVSRKEMSGEECGIRPLEIDLTENLYLRSLKPLRRRHTFFVDGKLYNENFSIDGDGLTIKTTPSSCSLLSGISAESSPSISLNSNSFSDEGSMRTLKISKADIKKGKSIGKGNSSVVHIGKMRSSGKKMALKVVNNVFHSRNLSQVFNEMQGLSASATDGSHSHPSIVNFYGAFLDNGAVTFCLEYMDAGSLADAIAFVAAIPEQPLAAMLYQACSGLAFLHDIQKMIHRDIKPSNILINTKGEVKLTDFGICRDFLMHAENSEEFDEAERHFCKTYVGTITYMSPERMESREYSFPADVWALGVTSVQAATGVYPFAGGENLSRIEVIEAVLEGPPIPNYVKLGNGETRQLTQEFVDFAAKTTGSDPASRLSAKLLSDHGWMIKQGIKSRIDAVEITKNYLSR